MSARHGPFVRLIIFLLLVLAGIWPGVGLARAQSLAEVARKEEARRQTIAEAAKVYTNKDLKVLPGDPPPPPAAATPAKAGDAPKDGEKAEKDAKDAKPPAKDQAYWSGRLKKLQDQVEKDEASFLAVQTTINTLTLDFVNRPDSGQRLIIESDRQKALADFSKLKQSIADGKKAIDDLVEEARGAGVPPGWVR